MRTSCFLLAGVLFFAFSNVYGDMNDAVDNNDLTFGSSSASISDWFSQPGITHDGVDAGRSGAVSHGQQSDLTAVVTGPGTLTFWWRVDAHADMGAGYFDSLIFWYAEGFNIYEYTTIFGQTSWEQKTVAIPEGTYTLNWSYSKDIQYTANEDAGFLDQVTWTPGTGDTTPPDNVSGFRAEPGDGEAILFWNNPADDFAGVRVQRRTDQYPTDENDGDTAYDGTADSFTDTGLANGQPYYYTAFSYDAASNFASGATAVATPFAPPPENPAPFAFPHWSDTVDGGATDYGRGIAFTQNGGFCVCGMMETAHPDWDGYLAIFNADGTPAGLDERYNSATGTSYDYFMDVCVDSDDNIIVTGAKGGGFPPYERAILTRRYTSAGVLDWERTYHTGAWNAGSEVLCGENGDIYVAGFEFGGWGAGEYIWSVLKYNSDGDLQSGFPINYDYSPDFDYQDRAHAMAMDAEGNLFVGGQRGNTTEEDVDWHIRGYTPGGVAFFEDTYTGTAGKTDAVRSLYVDETGDVYAAGYTTEASGMRQMLVIKYAAPSVGGKTTTTRIWEKTFSFGDDKEVAFKVMGGRPGELLVGGHAMDDSGIMQAALLRLDPVQGALLGKQIADNSVDSYIFDMALRGQTLAITGWAGNGTDNDIFSTLNQLGQYNLWILK